jgi:hypothetical protein
MARVATGARTHLGLYAELAEREERAAANGGRTVKPNGWPYTGNPERLADFRAGRPVALSVGDVPESARGDEHPRVWVWRRAVVWPDGEVQIRAATADEVLADLGL